MVDELKVRIYNVRFGDAILITVPDRDPQNGEVTTRRILVDVGNAPQIGRAAGGNDDVFETVVGSILDELGGHSLDLYVMTHEHLDHTQGLFYASTKLPALDLTNRLKVDYVWLTASADPDYYKNGKHPEAEKQRLAFRELYNRIAMHVATSPAASRRGMAEMLAVNDPTKTTQCVDFIRTLNPANTTYVHRGVDLAQAHPFREATFDVWAPEEDTADYYGRFQPVDYGVVARVAADRERGGEAAPHPRVGLADPKPPPGVDVGAFLQLVQARRDGMIDNLLAIDKAANNTSIVFAVEWRGWRLLFAGDAEVRSWRTMEQHNVLKSVHFLKVSHHGSHNGTPADAILEAILPLAAPDPRPRRAAISTWCDTYSGIPDPPTNTRLQTRVALESTLDHREELFYEITFPG
jgi:beta-lactamase superfamily II metal-dependent hydrolase